MSNIVGIKVRCVPSNRSLSAATHQYLLALIPTCLASPAVQYNLTNMWMSTTPWLSLTILILLVPGSFACSPDNAREKGTGTLFTRGF